MTLRTVLASLAERAAIEEIRRDFPALTEEDVVPPARSPRRPRKKTSHSLKRTSSGEDQVDENLPERLVLAFQDLGHEVDTVTSERLVGAVDPVCGKPRNSLRVS